MIIVSTDFVTGKEISTISLVSASVVMSKHIGRDIGASFKTIVGGELHGYTEMMDEAREKALQRVVQKAEAIGADAIVDIKFSSSAVMQGASEVMVYGTAVKFV